MIGKCELDFYLVCFVLAVALSRMETSSNIRYVHPEVQPEHGNEPSGSIERGEFLD
jgi:hypothetical protein